MLFYDVTKIIKKDFIESINQIFTGTKGFLKPKPSVTETKIAVLQTKASV